MNMAVVEVNDAIRRRLAAAREGGEIVTVRFVAGRVHRTRHAATGTVVGFERRPRECEKVRIRQRPNDLVLWDVPLRDIVAVESPVAKGARL
jgi:hypothetical protein